MTAAIDGARRRATRPRPGPRAPAGGSRSTARPRARPRSARVARILWLTPAMDRLWLEGAGERRRFLDRLTLSLVPDHGEVAAAYDRGAARAQPPDPRRRPRPRLVRRPRGAAWREPAPASARNRALALSRLAAAEVEGRVSRRRASRSRARGRATRPALREALRAGRAPRSRRRPHPDRAAPRRPRRRLRRQGRPRPPLLDRRAEGAARQPRPRQRPGGRRPTSAPRRSCSSTRSPPISTTTAGAALFAAIAGLGAQAFMTGTGPELFEGIDADRLLVEDASGESRVSRSPAERKGPPCFRSRSP